MSTPLATNGDLDSPTVLLNGITGNHQNSPSTQITDELANNEQGPARSESPDVPDELEPFDWKDFEARYRAALTTANDREKAVLKEAESLSKFFQSWASAASAHDDRRAVKRLQTRERFVHLSEEKLAQKQQHYVEVVRAFETALALLKTTS